MKKIDFSELHKYIYTVEITDFGYHWNTNDTYDCTEYGRKANGFLFYVDIESIHTFSDRTYNFKRNDFVYFPAGSKSKSIYTNLDETSKKMNGVNIKFILRDEEGVPFKLSDDVLIISNLVSGNYKKQLFEIANLLFANEPPMLIISKFYLLLTDISEKLNATDDIPGEYKRILNGIKYINENCCNNIAIAEAAQTCFMSESHFRKLFNKYMGISPVKYINELRIKKADELIKSGLFSIKEISEALGIEKPSYFSWFYKKHTGCTPSQLLPKKEESGKA